MGLLGTIIKGGASIWGGSKQAEEMQAAENIAINGAKALQANYDRRSNANYTQRGDAQRMFTLTKEILKDRSLAADRTAAVMGGENERAARIRQEGVEALGNTAADIAAAGAKYKDDLDENYLNRKYNYDQMLAGIKTGKAQQIRDAIAGVNSAVSDNTKNYG